MLRRPRKKLPRDPNQLAHAIVAIATSEDPIEEIEEPPKDPAAVALGRRGSRKGGLARAKKLTPKERSDIAKKAAKARWNKPDTDE